MALAVALLAAVVVGVDVVLAERRGRPFGVGLAAAWTAGYVALAALFALALGMTDGVQRGGEFAAGYVTEFVLGVECLFVLVAVVALGRVPAARQNLVLVLGLATALVLRGLLVLAGATAADGLHWLLYGFGAVLVGYAVVVLVRGGPGLTDGAGGRLAVLLTIPAVTVVSVLFAIDSVPALFGLTSEAIVVFASVGFALLALRPMFFVVTGLLAGSRHADRVLAVVVGLIGVKFLVATGVAGLPQPGVALSLAFVVIVLGTSAVLGRLR